MAGSRRHVYFQTSSIERLAPKETPNYIVKYANQHTCPPSHPPADFTTPAQLSKFAAANRYFCIYICMCNVLEQPRSAFKFQIITPKMNYTKGNKGKFFCFNSLLTFVSHTFINPAGLCGLSIMLDAPWRAKIIDWAKFLLLGLKKVNVCTKRKRGKS